MPFDLLATILMLALFVSILVIVILGIRKKRFGSKQATIILLHIVVLVGIPLLGHTNINREFQLKQQLNNSSVEILSSHYVPNGNIDYMYYEEVKMDNSKYFVTLICYTAPLHWSPFETWKVLNVVKE